jgi:peptidoglycan/LPS O-acetylase OafA/YrhL
MPTIVTVQYLRGLAAVMVVFQHALDQFPAFGALLPTKVGGAGVDIFFVISGFVMTYTTERNGYRAGQFLLRRAVRILPLYWAMTTLVAVLLFFAAHLVSNSRFTLDSYFLSLLFIPHANPGAPGSITPMLKLGWTLNFEVMFYLVFAALLWLRPIQRTLALAGIFAAIVIAAALFPPSAPPLIFFSNNIIFEFIFGCAVALTMFSDHFARVSNTTWALTLAASIALLLVGGADFTPTLPRCVYFGIPSALLVASVVGLERNAKRRTDQPLLHFLGDASYSNYLAHLYVVIAFRILWQRLGLPTEGWAMGITFLVACISVGVSAGCVTYLVIERPLTDLARNALLRRREAVQA